MKCPKCGYVGFEESARCRHCGYDFSLASIVAVPVAAGGAAAPPAVSTRDDGPGSPGRAGSASPTDRLGLIEMRASGAAPGPPLDLPLASRTPLPSDLFDESPPPARAAVGGAARARAPAQPSDHACLPRQAASLLDVPVLAPAIHAQTPAEAPTAASIAARAAAGLLDVILLGAIALAVVYLTARLSGLTMAQLDVLPRVPLAAFLVGQAAAYLAVFTACGGQTLGKMALGVRVVADDGAVPPGAAALAGADLARRRRAGRARIPAGPLRRRPPRPARSPGGHARGPSA